METAEPVQIVHERCCGLDVHKKLVQACALVGAPGGRVQREERSFSIMVAGLLRPSFIPSREQRELRELTRYRRSIIEERSAEVNRLQHTLEGANIKQASVASDVTGQSARAMLERLVAGQTDPAVLARCARGRMKEKIAAHDLPVTPHAGQAHNHQLVIAHLNSPIAEYFPPPPAGTLPDVNEAFWWIFRGEPLVEDGQVRLPGTPGLGLELNQEVVDTYRVPAS